MTMRQSFPSSQRSTNVSPLDNIGSQFGISEGHFPLTPIYEKTNTEMTSDEIQRVEMNRQIENYGQDTINNLMKVHLGNTTNNFAIGEAEPNQLSDIPTVNTVNYSGSINNDGRMNKLKVEKSQPECITETSENEFAFPDRIERRYQKESTMIISNPGASESITDGLAFAGSSRLQQNIYNSSLRSTEFQSELNLKQHSVVTSGQKLFSCKVCQKGYKHESTLKCHMRVHADIKPYECKFCGKAFPTKSALKTHVLIHTDEKPLTCDICGKGFTRNDDEINGERTGRNEARTGSNEERNEERTGGNERNEERSRRNEERFRNGPIRNENLIRAEKDEMRAHVEIQVEEMNQHVNRSIGKVEEYVRGVRTEIDEFQEKISVLKQSISDLEFRPNNIPASPDLMYSKPMVKTLTFDGQT
ncbi:Zinc finger protein Gfi-1b [Araneus ventricosus]|uniref:Zinc finger protein Gfi-1b n=1 Tax=Araneus ventricosus TaxID=182803 RepID=A0A4Y2FYG4_ARAVE|nr:Zinc finger protein Gfi-1b [Araneus ventricosus]